MRLIMATTKANVNVVEGWIQKEIVNRRVKLYQFFQDRDPMRTGYVTWNHFQNCLSRRLNINLTPTEFFAVKEKYDTRKNGTFNYRFFCQILEGMDSWFDSKGPPMKYHLSTPSPMMTHSALLEESVKSILKKLYSFYKAHAIDVYHLFSDVDVAREGIIPFGQFLRVFQVPSDFSEGDVKLVMQKYQAPERLGYFDYITFNNDMEMIGEPAIVHFRDTLRFRSRDTLLDLPPPTIIHISIKQIVDKVMRTVYRHNIHLYDYLNVYDLARCGVITEKQFAKGIWLAVGNQCDLTKNEIDTLARFFRNKTGQIPYREFCNVIDGAMVPPMLEENQSAKFCKMDMGHAKDSLKNVMNEDEERMYQHIINRLIKDADKRQLYLRPYFQEFEDVTRYPGLVSATDFSRVLELTKLDILPAELQLLCRKFEDPVTGGLFYESFLRDLEKGYQKYRVYNNEDSRKDDPRSYPLQAPVPKNRPVLVDVYEPLAKIRHHVMTKRIRVSEFFDDYDRSRVGSIAKANFIRGLDLMLVGTLSQECRISPTEVNVLVTHYTDPFRKGNVLWRKFELDVDGSFLPSNLDESTTPKQELKEFFNVKVRQDPLPSWITMHKCTIAMDKLRHTVQQRNLPLLQYFKDFDLANGGHVVHNQFDRTMKQYGLHLPEADWDVIKIIYSDREGFNYRKFLQDLQPPKEDFDRHPALLAMLKARLAAIQTRHPGAYADLLDLLFRLRTKMLKMRSVLLEYLREYDRQRRLRIPKLCFRRALDLATFKMTDREYELLERSFECPDATDQVNYMDFYDMINSVLAMKGLDKSPLATPFLFRTDPQLTTQNVGPEADKLLWTSIHRIARKLRQQPADLKQYFADFDPTHSGCVSRNQFARILDRFSYRNQYTEEELDAICARFAAMIGNRKDVDYRAFCSVLDHIAQNDQTREFWE